jgi:hypothetical protein
MVGRVGTACRWHGGADRGPRPPGRGRPHAAESAVARATALPASSGAPRDLWRGSGPRRRCGIFHSRGSRLQRVAGGGVVEPYRHRCLSGGNEVAHQIAQHLGDLDDGPTRAAASSRVRMTCRVTPVDTARLREPGRGPPKQPQRTAEDGKERRSAPTNRGGKVSRDGSPCCRSGRSPRDGAPRASAEQQLACDGCWHDHPSSESLVPQGGRHVSSAARDRGLHPAGRPAHTGAAAPSSSQILAAVASSLARGCAGSRPVGFDAEGYKRRNSSSDSSTSEGKGVDHARAHEGTHLSTRTVRHPLT